MLRYLLLVVMVGVWVCGCSPANNDPRLQSNATLRQACGGGPEPNTQADAVIGQVLLVVDAVKGDGKTRDDVLSDLETQCTETAVENNPDDPDPQANTCKACVGAIVDQVYDE